MAKIENQYYKAFLDGYLINEITRQDIEIVLNDLQHQHQEQAEVLIIVAWATGARPNEYLRLTPELFSRSKEFLEIRFPSSKGSSARTISMPRYFENIDEEDTFTKKVFEYQRKLYPKQYLFWFFRSTAVRHGVIKNYTRKDGTQVVKKYTKDYCELSSKLRYYFPKWFDCLFADGVPPYYLRHNRATKVMEKAGRGAAMQTFGWKREETLKKYEHKTPEMRRKIGKGLME